MPFINTTTISGCSGAGHQRFGMIGICLATKTLNRCIISTANKGVRSALQKSHLAKRNPILWVSTARRISRLRAWYERAATTAP